MDERRLVIVGLVAMAAGDLLLASGFYLLGDGRTAAATAIVGVVLGAVAVAMVRDDALLDPSDLPVGPQGRRTVVYAIVVTGLLTLLAGVVPVLAAITAG